MHPKLIQLRCCDRLWDYISKVSVVNFEEDSTRFKNPSFNIIQEIKRPGNPQVPTIFVSDSDVQHKTEKPSMKKVYFCGINDDFKWHRLVIGLCEKFLVRFGSCASNKDDPDVTRDLDEIDIVLFILDEQTIGEPQCIKLLKTALNSEKHVLFLRDEDYILPRDLLKAEYEDTEHEENLNIIQYDDSNSTWNISGSQITLFDDSRPISNLSQALRPDSGISLLSGRQSICSDDCKDQENRTEISVDDNLAPIIDPSGNSRLFTTFKNLDNATADLSYILRNGYNKALIYNTDNHTTFLEILKTNIEQCADEHLQTLMGNGRTDANANTNTMATADQSDVIENFGKTIARRESVDTVFIVCSSDLTPGVEPRIVHFPKDLNKINIPLSSSMESFGFQDIDLSKTLNDTDLFTPEELDEFD